MGTMARPKYLLKYIVAEVATTCHWQQPICERSRNVQVTKVTVSLTLPVSSASTLFSVRRTTDLPDLHQLFSLPVLRPFCPSFLSSSTISHARPATIFSILFQLLRCFFCLTSNRYFHPFSAHSLVSWFGVVEAVFPPNFFVPRFPFLLPFLRLLLPSFSVFFQSSQFFFPSRRSF